MSLFDFCFGGVCGLEFDITHDGNKVNYFFTLPGVAKDKIEIEHEDNHFILAVKDKKRGGKYRANVKRGFDEVKATLKHGILTVSLIYPKPIKTRIVIE